MSEIFSARSFSVQHSQKMKLTDFDLISSLGEGGDGAVILARCKKDVFDGIKKNRLVGIKVIRNRNRSSILRELEVSYQI